MVNTLYGVMVCPGCGVIQGRPLNGNVFKTKGNFKTIKCQNCLKPIPIMPNLYFKSESASECSTWIIGYKQGKSI